MSDPNDLSYPATCTPVTKHAMHPHVPNTAAPSTMISLAIVTTWLTPLEFERLPLPDRRVFTLERNGQYKSIRNVIDGETFTTTGKVSIFVTQTASRLSAPL